VKRAALGALIKNASQLLHDLPEGRALLEKNLKAGLPPQAQQTVDACVGKRASGEPAQLMRDMPAPVGNVRLLEPYTDRNGHSMRSNVKESFMRNAVLFIGGNACMDRARACG
jgi:hypothetical protein